jgi:hypothetical protein
MNIVGIDPGKTTGLCLYSGSDFIYGCEVEAVSEVIAFICLYNPKVVVIEDIVIGKRPSSVKAPLEILGVVKYVCETREIECVVQSPSSLHLMLPKVKSLSKSPHIRSACAHVTYYLMKRNAAKS